MTRAAIALGSNLGDRRRHLRGGVAGLRRLGDLRAVSPLYETGPVGGPEQPAYLNAVVVIDTELTAERLLAELHEIEAAAGRTREVHWGPRSLDLDLILHGGLIVKRDDLQVPHSRYDQRRFVLEPLLAAWPEATDPRGIDLRRAREAVRGQDLTQVEGAGWAGPTGRDPRRDRGGAWVAAQFVLLAAAGWVILATARSLPVTAVAGWVLGGIMLAGGLALGGAGLSALGRNLTPFPQPVPGGELVRSGVYRLVRHPLYGAVVLGVGGVALVARSIGGLIAAGVVAVFFRLKSGHEERRLERAFPDYPDYRRATPRRMIPWVF